MHAARTHSNEPLVEASGLASSISSGTEAVSTRVASTAANSDDVSEEFERADHCGTGDSVEGGGEEALELVSERDGDTTADLEDEDTEFADIPTSDSASTTTTDDDDDDDDSDESTSDEEDEERPDKQQQHKDDEGEHKKKKKKDEGDDEDEDDDDDDAGLPVTPSGGTSLERARKLQKLNFVLLLAATMCFKFSFETMSSAVALTVLDRIDGIGGATGVALLTILYSLSQSFSSLLVAQGIRRFRASVIVSVLFAVFAGLITIVIVLEASTGGTLDDEGTWNVWGIYPIYMSIGLCFGMIEVARKCIPPLIFGDSTSIGLKRANATVHICYEITGTAGAFLSTVFIDNLGSVYAMVHMPCAFLVSSIIFLCIRHRFIPLVNNKQQKKKDQHATKTIVRRCTGKATGFLRGCFNMGRDYFRGLKTGFKIIVLSRKYNWLLFAYVLPQVLHRLIENLLIPVYAKHVLHQGSYSGIMVGGSNFGELCGALLVAITAKKIQGRFMWVRFDAVCINLLWLYPFIHADALDFALGMIPVMAVVSGSWAAGDVTLLSYLQSTLPHDENDEDGDDITSPLGAALGFMYAVYVAGIAVLAFGLGQAIDQFKEAGDIRTGIMVLCIIFSACGAIAFVSTFFGKLQTEIREVPEEELGKEEEGKGDGEEMDQIENGDAEKGQGAVELEEGEAAKETAVEEAECKEA